ncbi:uncharacterized protein I303_108515 [Kwoniella dejecticola CBS 10117]|uniref:Uncharacterized protein n=1 Tax=Kwoniella dejecticola CBS 10117 TaxID=1296121 RepID=A0A1A5ZX69_9TREE|nr:uncharacterized protein I303_07161 [Kwoniella dejecticola CBS 10117]OBR82402.1 hypothetical protein I303_07161 [Kwoniella dejecticola CBS 10117]
MSPLSTDTVKVGEERIFDDSEDDANNQEGGAIAPTSVVVGYFNLGQEVSLDGRITKHIDSLKTLPPFVKSYSIDVTQEDLQDNYRNYKAEYGTDLNPTALMLAKVTRIDISPPDEDITQYVERPSSTFCNVALKQSRVFSLNDMMFTQQHMYMDRGQRARDKAKLIESDAISMLKRITLTIDPFDNKWVKRSIGAKFHTCQRHPYSSSKGSVLASARIYGTRDHDTERSLDLNTQGKTVEGSQVRIKCSYEWIDGYPEVYADFHNVDQAMSRTFGSGEAVTVNATASLRIERTTKPEFAPLASALNMDH